MSLIPSDPDSPLALREAFSKALDEAIEALVEAGEMSREEADNRYDSISERYPKSYDWSPEDFFGADEDDIALTKMVDDNQIQEQIWFYRSELNWLREIYNK